MMEQYKIISLAQNLLRTPLFENGSQYKVEFLIYRLKLLLLKMEKYGNGELASLCPTEELEKLNVLLAGAVDRQSAESVKQIVEDSLERIIAKMDPNDDIMCGTKGRA